MSKKVNKQKQIHKLALKQTLQTRPAQNPQSYYQMVAQREQYFKLYTFYYFCANLSLKLDK